MRPTIQPDTITAQLEADLKTYQAAGGKIAQVPRGVSGYTEEGKKWCRDRFSINGIDRKKRFKA